MSEKAAIVQLEYDARDDLMVVTRADGSVERVEPARVKRRIVWDQDRREVDTVRGLQGVVIEDG